MMLLWMYEEEESVRHGYSAASCHRSDTLYIACYFKNMFFVEHVDLMEIVDTDSIMISHEHGL